MRLQNDKYTYIPMHTPKLKNPQLFNLHVHVWKWINVAKQEVDIVVQPKSVTIYSIFLQLVLNHLYLSTTGPCTVRVEKTDENFGWNDNEKRGFQSTHKIIKSIYKKNVLVSLKIWKSHTGISFYGKYCTNHIMFPCLLVNQKAVKSYL